MAKNKIFEALNGITVAASDPATPESGDLVRYGQLIGIAKNDEDADGNTVVDFSPSAYEVPVKGEDGDGNDAVAAGDTLYYTDGEAFLSKKDSGYFAGIALDAVTSGATSTIRVILNPSVGPGAMNITDGSIGGNELAAGLLNVTLVAGGAAGDHVVAGIAAGDEIVFVGHFSTAASIATLDDLTGEFTAGAGVINNDGGTATTDDQLMVIWIDKT